jgi:hypothetical protein
MPDTVVNMNQHNNGHRDDPSNLSWIQFNFEYFKTNDGILKLVQMVSQIAQI